MRVAFIPLYESFHDAFREDLAASGDISLPWSTNGSESLFRGIALEPEFLFDGLDKELILGLPSGKPVSLGSSEPNRQVTADWE